MSDEIDIKGLDEADLLVALYHGTRPLGLGKLHDDPMFNRARAQQYLDHAAAAGTGVMWFDYVDGRPIKLCLDRNAGVLKCTDVYDRDAGHGRCAEIVAGLRDKITRANDGDRGGDDAASD